MTASCGIACNRMLAKICSDLNKPNGQTVMPNDEVEILKFMRELPIRKIPGVGKVNEHILNGLNIYFCKDVVERATDVYVTFTEWAYEFLVKSALGIARVMHETDKEGIVGQKSMGVSSTFKSIHRYG
jgi:DNA polymerase kappa